MKYKIKFLPETVADREAIKNYLSQYYESTVIKFFQLLKSKIARLKEFPYSCPTYGDDPDYRKLTVGDYQVFYMVNEDNKTIEIHRIFHSSQNIVQYLNKPSGKSD